MKVAKGFFSSREYLAKQAAKRSQRRIAEHLTLSTAFKPEDSKIIQENMDSIARYANKKRIDIAFEPSSENLRAPKMDVSRREVKFMELNDGSETIPYLLPEYAGSAVLPEGINNKKDLMDAIRAAASKILYEKK